MPETASVIIVFYNPELSHIENANKLAEKMNVVVVDNSPLIINYSIDNANVIKLGRNLGIAAAINIGLKYSLENGYTYSIVLDQDSSPNPDDLAQLIKSASLLSDKHKLKVAAVSPAYYDNAINTRCSFIKIIGSNIIKLSSEGDRPIEVSYTITSGTVFFLNELDTIGYMDESLFIDFVDLEWCFRAGNKGYSIFGIPTVLMEHEIGCSPIKILGKTYVNHSPIRHYYYFRNAVELIKRHYVPYAWKKMEILKLIPRFLVYAFLTENKYQHTKMMVSGFWDGVKGKLGPYDD